jgi:hypothetical protein
MASLEIIGAVEGPFFIFYKLESIGYLENFWNKRK